MKKSAVRLLLLLPSLYSGTLVAQEYAITLEMISKTGGCCQACFPIGDQYVYAQYGDDLAILDVSAAEHPQRVNMVQTNGTVLQLVQDQAYAYLGKTTGISLLDIGDQARPQSIFYLNVGPVMDLHLQGSFLYALRSNGLLILDVQDKHHVKSVAEYACSASAMLLDGDYAYIHDSDTKLTVLNIHNPAQPQPIATFTTDEHHLRNMQLKSPYLYLLKKGTLEILDISNPGQIKQSSLSAIDLFSFTINGDQLIAGTSDGVDLYDISRPANPVKKSSLSFGKPVIDVKWNGNRVFCVTSMDEVRIIGYSDPDNLQYRGRWRPETARTEDVQVKDNLAFLANGEGGASIIDVSDPYSPFFLSHIQTEYTCEIVRCFGHYVYLKDASELRIYDIQSPSAPVFCGTFKVQNTIMDLCIHNHTAFILCQNDNLIIADLKNPALPQVLCKIPLPLSGNDMASHLNVVEPYAYVLTSNGKLVVIDTGDFTNPKTISVTDVGPTWPFFTNGRYLYVFPNAAPAKIFTVENPAFVQQVANFYTQVSNPGDVTSAWNYLLVGGSEIGMFNVGSPLAPTLAAKPYSLNGSLARKMAIKDNMIYIADYTRGLHIIRMSGMDSNPYEVTNTNDSGPGSLRQALANAALCSDALPIVFKIPRSDPGYRSADDVWTIRPAIIFSIGHKHLNINGASQARYLGLPEAGPPKIEIDGSFSSDGFGISFYGADGSGLNGLIVNNFAKVGIAFQNMDQGFVYNCYIGTDATGTIARGNGTGISIAHASNIGIAPLDSTTPGCIVSGNNFAGISVSDTSYRTYIYGNTIGLDRFMTKKLGNSLYGILLQTACAKTAILKNVLCGNGYGIYDESGFGNDFAYNFIGTDSSARIDLGNEKDGIHIEATMDICFSNTIAFNHEYGVQIAGESHTSNTLSANSIFSNHAGGIDTRDGGNDDISPPQILSASQTAISGLSGAGQYVEVFADSSGQGRYFLGATKADPQGNFLLTLEQRPDAMQFTATTCNKFGSTSRFSPPCVISDVPLDPHQPEKFTISRAYPNPFNTSVTLQITLPHEEQVTVQIYNQQGQRVREMLCKRLQPGTHQITWQGTDDAGKILASGVYYFLCKAGALQELRKAVLLK
jgi:hypothetical protein